MDLEKLEKMVNAVKKHVAETGGLTNTSFSSYRAIKAQIQNIMVIGAKLLPDHKEFFNTVSKELGNYDGLDAQQALEYISTIIKAEKASETKIKEMRIFESADEKMKQAGLSFQKDDYPSVFHSLNTALELVIKDKIGIPTTITSVNTSNVIEVLVKYKVQPYLYLAEAKKHVITIDNKTKHQGYSPSKVDCINSMKAMEELIARLRNMEIKLPEEVRNKIYEGL